MILVIGVLLISLDQPHGSWSGTDMASPSPRRHRLAHARAPRAASDRALAQLVVLLLGALVFLFPFYYMVIGSLQTKPDTSLRGRVPDRRPDPATTTRQINSRVDLRAGRWPTPAIFTGGVILGTVVFGVLAGYALARLQFRGRGTLFAVMLLVQIVPFQLLIIPIYVMIVRTYGLADSYLGMILPFAINSTAVFIFRQFFLQLPEDLFSAAARSTAPASCGSCGRSRCRWCGPPCSPPCC